MITLTFGCGHTAKLPDDALVAVCPTCGERRVQQVKARAPRFRGVVLGPHATFEALSGVAVNVGVTDAE